MSVATLLQREVVRFVRQKNRIMGALGTPLIFWFLIGSGFGRSFQTPSLINQEPTKGLSYLQYFFPGTIVMILLFTAIYSTISVIEDRREGFLQGVLVAPVSRWAIVLGKILGGTVLATGQGLLFLLLAPLLGIHLSLPAFLYVFLIIFLMSLGLTGLGLFFAWRMDSTQGFHAIMNLFLLPLWFLSGALFPAAGATAWLAWIMKVNPLSYSVAALHRGFYHGLTTTVPTLPSATTCLVVNVVFALGMFWLTGLLVNRSAPKAGQ